MSKGSWIAVVVGAVVGFLVLNLLFPAPVWWSLSVNPLIGALVGLGLYHLPSLLRRKPSHPPSLPAAPADASFADAEQLKRSGLTEER